MKSYIVAAIFLTVISIMITVYCQADEDEEGMTYFELGRQYDGKDLMTKLYSEVIFQRNDFSI